MRLLTAALFALTDAAPAFAAPVTNHFSATFAMPQLGVEPELFEFGVTYDPDTITGAFSSDPTYVQRAYSATGTLRVGGETANVGALDIFTMRRTNGLDVLSFRYLLNPLGYTSPRVISGNCYVEGGQDGFSFTNLGTTTASCADIDAIHFTFAGPTGSFFADGVTLAASMAGVESTGVSMGVQMDGFMGGPRFIHYFAYTMNGVAFDFDGVTGIGTGEPPVAAVPLPAGGLLLLAGLGAIGAVRRRR